MKNSLVCLIQEYIVNYSKITRNFSINTIKSYSYDLLDFIKFLRKNKIDVDNLLIEDIKIEIIEKYIKYLRDKGNKAKTVNRKISTLRSLFAYAETKAIESLDINNKIKQIKMAKEEMQIQDYYTEDEMKLIFQCASTGKEANIKYLCMLTLLYDCGLRASELCDIKLEDLVLNKDTCLLIVKNGKGRKSRTIPIDSKEVIRILKEYLETKDLERGDYLFYNNKHQKYTRSGIRYIVKKYCTIAKEKCEDKTMFNIKPHPHVFRHSKGVHLTDNGVSIIITRDILGHKSIETTEIYARISTKKKMEILNKNAETIPLNYKKTKKEKSELEEYLNQIIKNS